MTWDLWEVRLEQRYSGPWGIHVSCKSPVRSTKLQSLVPSCKLLTSCNQHNLPSANVCMCVQSFHKGRQETPDSVIIMVHYELQTLESYTLWKEPVAFGVMGTGTCCGKRRESYHKVLAKVTQKRWCSFNVAWGWSAVTYWHFQQTNTANC